MNLILVCVFNLLLFNSISGNGAQAAAFNEDFQYPIFDLAEFEQILEMAKKPESAEFVKNHIFAVKYPNYTFALQIENSNRACELYGAVYFPNVDYFVDVITHFGSQMKKIGIINIEVINEEQSAILFGNISEYCSDSLVNLNLGGVEEYTFKHFTKPLLNMKRLSLSIGTHEVGSILPFDEIFPILETLRIEYYVPLINVQNNGKRFYESEFPAMEHLKELLFDVRVQNPPDVALIQEQVRNLLQKNRQIQRVAYVRGLNDFIQELNEYLPNLEQLVLHDLDRQIQPVQFENVKYFNFATWDSRPVERLSFPRLELLEMFYQKSNSNESLRNSWIQFFKNHQNFRRLDCTTLNEDEGFIEFVSELPNLREIRINSYHHFNISFVSQLIESPNNWVKFHYDANPRDLSVPLDMNAFVEKFQNEWNITYNFEGRQFVELERKN